MNILYLTTFLLSYSSINFCVPTFDVAGEEDIAPSLSDVPDVALSKIFNNVIPSDLHTLSRTSHEFFSKVDNHSYVGFLKRVEKNCPEIEMESLRLRNSPIKINENVDCLLSIIKFCQNYPKASEFKFLIDNSKALASINEYEKEAIKCEGEFHLRLNKPTQDDMKILKHDKIFTDVWLNFVDLSVMPSIAEALQANEKMTSLYLDARQFGEAGAKVIAIADALKVNSQLTKLTISGTNIGATGAQAIADALKVNEKLTILYLIGTNIGVTGAKAIADALKVNEKLKTLALGFNNIGATGAKAIADALKVNEKLKTLLLGGNEIGATGAQAIADALKINRVLTFLDLEVNQIGVTGAQAIADALKVNTQLKLLAIGGNRFGPGGSEAIAEALRENENVRVHNLDFEN